MRRIRQWDPRAEKWAPICASTWDLTSRSDRGATLCGATCSVGNYTQSCPRMRFRGGAIEKYSSASPVVVAADEVVE
jgi:hypothetical protein